MLKIAILGGGVSGSLLAYLIKKYTNNYVKIFDIKDRYIKPCGDIVPNVFEPPNSWPRKYDIKRFAFYLDGERVYDIQYRSTKWIVIDKWKWINDMRKEVDFSYVGNFNGKEFDMTIDSKGPYDLDRKVVYTTRVLLKTDKFDDEAVIEFNTKYTGFYWIFPSEDGVYNIGAGFIEDKNSRDLTLKYIKEKFGDREYKIVDIRGAPISISPIHETNYKIGEARGLLFPLSGEGIRPSAISAVKAFEAIKNGKDFNKYLSEELKKIHEAISVQHMFLKLYLNSSLSLRKQFLRLFFKNEILIDAYLEDKITFEGIAESVRSIKGGSLLRKL
ncbi:NAD(P)/FAD-dependent oxidoreductase [Sulfolobus acidocaldarius]|uniref:Conserved Archaeal protein n=4 Tax=Sulfolobus acidocaldarius TaxID=2285 RepID=Q4J8X0_SULAC|nr:NAD(P)/FAD-dependent oxidoreductase [Sulfolobus acidocaldarius]AAY80760.1 conserved Archaeal protein [Sulfolobus acidocaldarius DSM 639]AGE71356.1 hypothetical protein SacN8_06960 [Sulfolobus acidocaldarius N8]AGE73627.1 hypothetical protein SacRon12I_06960 [Sulfolobus acidocaldarius Ron12/I]ALU30392.1 dehydrogenase [Sulfolobus acidocaldarius]ALU31113.1 dehydrogenase [Sulfolobus acidocaldarius]